MCIYIYQIIYPNFWGQQLFEAPRALTLSEHVWTLVSDFERSKAYFYHEAWTLMFGNQHENQQFVGRFWTNIQGICLQTQRDWSVYMENDNYLTYWRSLTCLKINGCYHFKEKKHVWRPCPALCQPWCSRKSWGCWGRTPDQWIGFFHGTSLRVKAFPLLNACKVQWSFLNFSIQTYAIIML